VPFVNASENATQPRRVRVAQDPDRSRASDQAMRNKMDASARGCSKSLASGAMTGGVPPIVEVRDLDRTDLPNAIEVLSRGMRDNPLHFAAFGDDPERRTRCVRRMFTTLFRVSTTLTEIGAFDGDTLVGLAGVAAPGTCQPTATQRLRYLPGMLSLGPRSAGKLAAWLKVWAAHDPDEAHSHLGPVAVDTALQGRGIGTRLLGEYARRLDAGRQVGYLETDKPENVAFYERFGFVVTGEAEVIGAPNWFMRREPAA
jgi:ribosomal protein S18 acetylase RimI-like enzyme